MVVNPGFALHATLTTVRQNPIIAQGFNCQELKKLIADNRRAMLRSSRIQTESMDRNSILGSTGYQPVPPGDSPGGMPNGVEVALTAYLPQPTVFLNPDMSQIGLGSARASPKACTSFFHHTVGAVDAQTVGEAPTGTRGGACAPHHL